MHDDQIPEDGTSLWVATSPALTKRSRLDANELLREDDVVDVVIVGAGITGITAALLLQRAGKRVVVLEGREVAHGVTGYTTAHLTEAIDTRFTTLIRDFGVEGARLAADASRVAMERIARFIDEKSIECEFRRLSGYLYTEREEDVEALHREHHAALEVGLAVEMTRAVPLPFRTAAAVRFPNQAEFHVTKYLRPLCEELESGGGLVFEGARVREITDGDPCSVTTESGRVVKAKHVIVAANVPLNRVFLQTKIAHYRSYVIAARVREPSLEGLFWDTDSPYHYLRSAEGVLIVGGEDHKTGTEEDTMARYEKLLAYTRERFVVEDVKYRWSAQVIEPADGLPFIGRNSLDTRVFVATAFSGNGMTFGTAAAILLSDLVLGVRNPWQDLFEPTRIKPVAAAKDFVTNNAEVGVHFITDRLKAPDAKSLLEVAPGEGKIVRVKGQRLAVYRDQTTHALTALSPVCPHLGCHVKFNAAEKSWDCPCHGSRFTTKGEVINGPSMAGLKQVVVQDEGDTADDAPVSSQL